MKKIFVLLVGMLILLSSCNKAKREEEAAVNKEALENEAISELSIYNLPATWTNQNNEEIVLKDLKGDVLVMVMIYTSCKAACPRLVADMRDIETQIPKAKKGNVKLILVSIDPETDTPQRLKEFSIENEMESNQWVFLRGSEGDTREFAAVLAVNYKKISPMDFSHSNIISVFDQGGELVHQQEGLGVNNKETVAKIIELAN
ncbi:redoxin domain-containing protein [Leptobacterium flavescens]|uniref:Redoxin domain-containing protein n=1 Tax=Leptobacterium flavescens TaxID=472055 RepID=A0A6P0UQD9_9FLAO|nr:SCO family protein [Leptobacterium flavescens]NER14690.1 redoxin domain-containing protein [Leptobacterium flavescens]